MATSRRYAQGTTVPSDRSIVEIQKLVKVHGGTNWSHAEADDETPPRAWVQFKLQGWVLRFTITLPTSGDVAYSPAGTYRPPERRKTALEEETRRRWRELVLLLKAKLVAIESGIVTVEQEMLPYIVLQDDRTAAEHIVPRLAELQAAAQGTESLPLLPPMTITEDG